MIAAASHAGKSATIAPPMTSPSQTPVRKDPFAALRYAEFRHLILANLLQTLGRLIQEVTIGYELYRLTGNALMLGYVGLAQVLPFMAVALFGGHVADRRDKRSLMAMSQLIMLLASVALFWIMLPSKRENIANLGELTTIYSAMAVMGLARAFYQPANSSLRAQLVPREIYSNASAWGSTFWQGAAICGPAVAGLIIAAVDVAGTMALVVGFEAVALFATLRLKPRPPVETPERESIWRSLGAGLQFVWRTPLILYAITLDMVAVLCGGVIAILPVFSIDILQVGPEGLGIMRAAPAAGAMLTMLACAAISPTHKPWRNLLLSVVGFGVATLVFAVSKSFWLSIAALFFTGAFDAISVVVRQTILQAVPPDHLRGRVLSVSGIFISASNELGAFSSSAMVRFLGAVPGVLFGASLTLVSVAVMWRRGRGLSAERLDAG